MMENRVSHWRLIQSCLHMWTRGDADLRIICQDGFSVYSHTALFGMFSTFYKDILLPHEEKSSMISIYVPVNMSTVKHLIDILLTGSTNITALEEREHLEELSKLFGVSININPKSRRKEILLGEELFTNIKQETKINHYENETNESDLKTEIEVSNNTQTSSFQCKPCNLNLSNTNELMKHFSRSSIDVDTCWEAFYDEEKKKNEEAKKLLCEECLKIQTHDKPNEICQKCRDRDLKAIVEDKGEPKLRFAELEQTDQIQKVKAEGSYQTCLYCPKTFLQNKRNKLRMERHIRIKHKAKPSIFNCKPCRINFLDINALKDHCNISSDSKSCKEAFDKKGKILQNYMNRVPCDECSRAHKPADKHDICQYCDKKFVVFSNKPSQLGRHLREIHLTHPPIRQLGYDPDNELHCHICKEAVHTEGVRIFHEDKHAQDKEDSGRTHYKCRFCSYQVLPKFANRLKNHLYSHTGEKSFMCFECGMSFKTHNNRNNHERTHTNLLNYSCDYCDKKFNQPGGLYYHKKNKHKEM